MGHQAATMIEVPRALRNAVAQWRGRICRHIETIPVMELDELDRAWKLFMASDILLFGDLREEEGAHSKTRRISDRLHSLNLGRWSAVWNLIGDRPEPGASLDTEEERTAKRASQLLDRKGSKVE